MEKVRGALLGGFVFALGAGACGAFVGTEGAECNSRGLCLPGLVCVQGTCEASTPRQPDVGTDAGVDAGIDAGVDAGIDAGVDAGIDAGVDAGIDAGVDAGIDAGVDAGIDAGVDAGIDAGPPVAADMVDVPAGPFLAGCNTAVGEQCLGGDNELPSGTMNLPGFRIDRTEVTAAAYAACVTAGVCTAPTCSSDSPQHPVVCVDWNQARAFCGWRGARLPSEEEWEKAARGTEGRIWPTGNTEPTCTQANINNCEGRAWAAGSQPATASPYGALDMVGNVWEWTESAFDANTRVFRGGGWGDVARNARASVRFGFIPSRRFDDIGFRCAIDAGVDAGIDAGVDAGIDAGVDAGIDAGVDAGIDAGVDAGIDAGVDAGIDAGVDAGIDAGVDAGIDAGVDDAGVDAGIDAGPPVAADMVDVPAGPFLAGCNTAVGEQCLGGDNELPSDTMNLPGFRIDRTEVTAAAYAACVTAGVCTAPTCSSDSPQHPVVCVDWNQARAFCGWRGARLPSEEEWEKAARGTEGRIWPTGNTEPTCTQANIDNCEGRAWAAGSQPATASPYGALDMVGNVWEWTESAFDANTRVFRGGGWGDVARNARASVRFGFVPSRRFDDIGFRCAQSAS